jgi:hypothetical protein
MFGSGNLIDAVDFGGDGAGVSDAIEFGDFDGVFRSVDCGGVGGKLVVVVGNPIFTREGYFIELVTSF